MATQDNSAGLLSKVARFVRNPSSEWGAFDSVDDAKAASPTEGESSKLDLKKMIERKRHNDSVRKREFDALRKLRSASAVAHAEQVSAFQGTTNYSDLDERALTLKKIDAIEAQMAKQWWKNKPVPSPAPASGQPVAPVQGTRAMLKRDDFATTEVLESVVTDAEAATLMGQAANSELPADNTPDTRSGPDNSRTFDASEQSVFSASKIELLESDPVLSDPVLEEASIRFANGDSAGAQAILLEMLQQTELPPEAVQAWAGALFDCYRSTGQAQAFDQFALDYAQRFGLTAPPWLPVPALPAATDAGPLGASQRQVQLAGELLGDCERLLADLLGDGQPGSTLLVACAGLIRVDFSAAGSLLNWAANAQSSGVGIELQDVPQLVAVFFRLIGIADYAHITVRNN